MNLNRLLRSLPILTAAWSVTGADRPEAPKPEANPADHLPPHISRLTYFGERADFSHDGKKLLFVEKTYGDAFEVDLSTKIVRPVTHHFYHGGFVRALYLANGDILLSGSKTFDSDKPHLNRTENAELWILDKSLTKPPVRLGEKCSEGPAVSRTKMLRAHTTSRKASFPMANTRWSSATGRTTKAPVSLICGN
jgi:hypothetical protein